MSSHERRIIFMSHSYSKSHIILEWTDKRYLCFQLYVFNIKDEKVER